MERATDATSETETERWGYNYDEGLHSQDTHNADVAQAS